MALKRQPNGKPMHPKMARIGSSVGHFKEPVLQNARMHFLRRQGGKHLNGPPATIQHQKWHPEDPHTF